MSDLPEQKERPPSRARRFCWQQGHAHPNSRSLRRRSFWGVGPGSLHGNDRNCLDRQSGTFTTLQSHIAKKSCLGVTTIKKALPALRALAVIAYQTPKLRGPITFTLLAASRLSSAASQPALAKTRFQRNLATVEESIEESVRRTIALPFLRNVRAADAPPVQLVDDDHLRELKQIYRPCDVDKAVAACRAWLLTPAAAARPSPNEGSTRSCATLNH